MQQIINIDGMTCHGCVKSVENVLNTLPGVTQVSVNLEQHHATITFNDSQVSIDRIIEEIDDAGFDASI